MSDPNVKQRGEGALNWHGKSKQTFYSGKSKQAALAESNSLSASVPSPSTPQDLSFRRMEPKSIPSSNATDVHKVPADWPTTPPFTIIRSSDPAAFVITPPDSPPIPSCNPPTKEQPFVSTKSTRKIDKAMEKIRWTNSPSKQYPLRTRLNVIYLKTQLLIHKRIWILHKYFKHQLLSQRTTQFIPMRIKPRMTQAKWTKIQSA